MLLGHSELRTTANVYAQPGEANGSEGRTIHGCRAHDRERSLVGVKLGVNLWKQCPDVGTL